MNDCTDEAQAPRVPEANFFRYSLPLEVIKVTQYYQG